jgi:hypothetical protein
MKILVEELWRFCIADLDASASPSIVWLLDPVFFDDHLAAGIPREDCWERCHSFGTIRALFHIHLPGGQSGASLDLDSPIFFAASHVLGNIEQRFKRYVAGSAGALIMCFQNVLRIMFAAAYVQLIATREDISNL